MIRYEPKISRALRLKEHYEIRCIIVDMSGKPLFYLGQKEQVESQQTAKELETVMSAGPAAMLAASFWPETGLTSA